MRKPPYKHPVSSHVRDGTSVDSYVRGTGPQGLPSIKLADPTLSLRLPTLPIPTEQDETFGEPNETLEESPEDSGLTVSVSESWDGGHIIRVDGLTDDEFNIVKQAEEDKKTNLILSESLIQYKQNILPKLQSQVEPDVYQQLSEGKFWANSTGNGLQIEVPKIEEVNEY